MSKFAHLLVGRRHDPRQEFDHGDLGPQPPPDRTQLEPDIAGTDDHQVVGNLVERKRPGRIDDRPAVEWQERQVHRLRPGRQQDVAALEIERCLPR